MSEKKYPSPRPKAVDLFCGAGGMSLGFEQAGFDVVLGVDYDGHHVAAHQRNFPHSRALCMSVANLTADQIREATGIQKFDLVFGGPPCQGFSNMGHRHKDDPRNTLVDEFARIVIELRPKAFVMENVPAMISGETREILDRVIERFESAGYKITKPIRKLTASDFGVPQIRTRLFVLGILTEIHTEFEYPTGPCIGQPARPTVWQAISDLPHIEKHEKLFTQDFTPYDRTPRDPYARVARGLDRDPSDFSIPRQWVKSICTGVMRTRHAPASVEMYTATPPGGFVPGHKLPKLDPNGLAPTLRAGSDSTRGSYTAPRPVHPFLGRVITAREAARLHGYPDWFWFFPTKWHAYKQIGNSVCPPVARAVGSSLMRALGVKYRGRVPSPVELTETFSLPEDRPRQSKRLPQVRMYPPVIRALFQRAYDESAKKLRRPRFTFADVQQVIKETGVNLNSTRENTFIQEIARSRNVLKLLAYPRALGFTIAPLDEAPYIGTFVPVGAPGSIEFKEELSAKASDMSSAIILRCHPTLIERLQESPDALLRLAEVRSRLWKSAADVGRPEALFELTSETSHPRVQVHRTNGRKFSVPVIIGSHSNVPPMSRIKRIATAEQAAEVIALTPITAKHVLVSRFTKCLDVPLEADRWVFVLNGESAEVGAA